MVLKAVKDPHDPLRNERADEFVLPKSASEVRIRAALATMDPADPQHRILTAFCDYLRSLPKVMPEAVSEPVFIPRGADPIMRENDVYDGVYVILDGSVEIESKALRGDDIEEVASPNGSEGVTIRRVRKVAPDIVGEVGALTGTRTATVRPGEGGVTLLKISQVTYAQFIRQKMVPELQALVFKRVPNVRDTRFDQKVKMEGMGGKHYPPGLEPSNEQVDQKNALLFLALKNNIAPQYTEEAIAEVEERFSANPDDEAAMILKTRMYLQLMLPDNEEANQVGWHEYGVWEHTRQVGNAIQHIDRLDPYGVAKPYLHELQRETVEQPTPDRPNPPTKYDLLQYALTLHDLGKAKQALMIDKKTNEPYLTHTDHERRSEELIQRAVTHRETGQGAHVDAELGGLLYDQLELTTKEIEYIGRLAALHFEFGKVRRAAGKDFNMKFMKEDPRFMEACDEIFKDETEARGPYKREIGLLFLLDTAGKTAKDSWEIEGVAPGELPTDEQITAQKAIWKDTLHERARDQLVAGYESFQTSRATALQYLRLLRERNNNQAVA
jgi:CRP-like cAMP-binding protein